ncbi:MAG: EAL domain-containing protein [Methylococcales bacterium]|nr:EAL domain-containing protein [Methylococcales bacterium]MDD5753596.1 EAL domain-containing protein [Methylococcales bacterium]
MTNFIIGRQQIFDKNLNISAYELFFRGNNFDLSNNHEATLATHQVMTDSILEIGLNNIVDEHKAFINFTTQNILEKTPLNLPKDRVVIEIQENVNIDSPVIYNLREMSQKGYLISLDNFSLTHKHQKLLEFVDIIKLDVLAMGENRVREIITQLKFYDVKILAAKVETRDAHKYLQELGCDYFQGFFFNKPNLVAGKRIGSNQLDSLRLLALANNPNVEFDELVREISQNLSLCYKILCYINSAAYPSSIKIKSISQAIAYLGLNELKRWINLVVLSSLSNKPSFIIQNSLIRGKMCELLATLKFKNKIRCGEFFLIGILSSLDNLLDLPLKEALEQLPLSDYVTDAILYHKDFGGEALRCVLNYEFGNFDEVTFSDVPQFIIGNAYIESLSWARNIKFEL